MNTITIKFLNTFYLMRMLKDKTYQSIINWYYGDMKNVERIYKENETIYNHISKLCTKMTPIIDNLILGNACDASFYYHMKNANIGTIINVTKEIPNYFQKDFEYYKIPLNDQNHESFTNELFERVNTYISINTSNKKDKHILVHCYMGSSRSATIVSAYMIKKYGYTVEECVKILRSKRDIVNINTKFAKNLQDYWEFCRNAKNKPKVA
jgi:protein-tyrosine phosphatase